ncbi:transcriptional regulator GlxA family with amidase domain [Deinococcus metalli]|uniref:Glutamine amidotransferase n=1 Tax=Deinococcus metalli TaxID=1141878 RepID=A0A7W8NNQ8_9DEIO|nr:DJ-1/PfpI family protein [Deinococcus metalli]MBB5377179.1 transcriptional regulator GlxA family with amidase domain [Deinococcus metalli]GHF48390.1 glutamine amidotransferase [Deinococcus metalli]
MTRTVGILIFDDIEVLDLGGPFEVLSVASRLAVRNGEDAPFAPVLIARDLQPVSARGGLRVLPQATLTAHPPLDVLLVPGGVVDAVQGDPQVVAWVRAQAASAELTASICTGAFVLAQAGLLDGRRVTTHWEDQADLARQFPALTVIPDVSWVDGGDVLTSGGISAGIDLTLHLVERLHSRDLAERTARQMDYRWTGTGMTA